MKRSILLICILFTLSVVIALWQPPFCKPAYDFPIADATDNDFPPNTAFRIERVQMEGLCLRLTVTNTDTVANYIHPSRLYTRIGQAWYALQTLNLNELDRMERHYTRHEPEIEFADFPNNPVAPGDTVELHIDYPKRYGILGPGEYLFQFSCTAQGNYAQQMNIFFTIQ